MRVGIIGCGAISGQYLKNLANADTVSLVACADLDESRARSVAEKVGGARVLTPDALIADPDIDIILNLTIPAAHTGVNLAALSAGKHVYAEKPLAVSLADGESQVRLARAKGVLLGVAPDTVLGPGIQTCRELILKGAIGQPVSANAFMMSPGVESWHPNPEFYYKPGGGPMFDMGPYYLTALITLMGPIDRVQGATRLNRPQRVIGSEPFRGKVIDVEIPTHVTGLIEFSNGAVGTITTSFDIQASRLPPIEVYGTEGSLSVPDPNGFGGPVLLRRKGSQEWEEMELLPAGKVNGRGLGLVDLAEAAQSGRAPRASGELGLHVLEAMHAFHESSDQGRSIQIKNRIPG